MEDLNEKVQESVNSQNVREYSIIFPDENETSEEDNDEEKGEDMSLNSTLIKSLIAEYCKQMSEQSIYTHSKTLDKESIPQVHTSKICACSKEYSNKVHIDPNPRKPELTIKPNTSASSTFDLTVGCVDSSVSMYSDYVNLAFKFPIELFSKISLAVLKNQQELASGTKEQETRDSNQECHSREFIDIQELNTLRQEILQKTKRISLEENGTNMLNKIVAVQETETNETQKSVVAKHINLENTSDLRWHVCDNRLQNSILPIHTGNAEIISTGMEANKSAFENAENDRNGISRAAASKIQIVHTGSDKRTEVSEVDIVQLESSLSNDKFPLKTFNVVDNELHKNSVSQGTCEDAAISEEIEHGSANISSRDIIPSLEEKIEKRNETEITSNGCTASRTDSMTSNKAKMQTSDDNCESSELTHSENVLEETDCEESSIWWLTEMGIEVEKIPMKETKREISNIVTKCFEFKVGGETVIVKVKSDASQIENISIDAFKCKTAEIYSIPESKLSEINYTQKDKINSTTCESSSSKRTEFETPLNIVESSGVGVEDSVLNEPVNNTILRKTKSIQELQHESAENKSDSLSLEELIPKEVAQIHGERYIQEMPEIYSSAFVQSRNFAMVETTQKPDISKDLIERYPNASKIEIAEESSEFSEIEIIQGSSDGLPVSETHQDFQQLGNDESDKSSQAAEIDTIKKLLDQVVERESSQLPPLTLAITETVQELKELSANKNLSSGLSPEKNILNVSKDSENAVKDAECSPEITECGFDQVMSLKPTENAVNIMHDLADSSIFKEPKQNLADMDRAVESQESTEREIVGEQLHEFTENESSQETSHKSSGSLTTEEFPIKVTESETVKVQSVDSTASELNQKSSQELAENKTAMKEYAELTQSEPQQKASQKPPDSLTMVEFSNKAKENKMANEQSIELSTNELNLKSSPNLTEGKPDQISRQNSAESNSTIVVLHRSTENDQKQFSPDSAKETSKNELLMENKSCRKLSEESMKNQAMETPYQSKEEESNKKLPAILKSPQKDDCLEVLNESGQQVEIPRSMTLNESGIEFPLSEKDEDEQLESSYLNDKFPHTSNVEDYELHKISDSEGICEDAAISKEVEYGSANIPSVVDTESSHNKMNTMEVDVILKNIVIDANQKELSENILQGKPAILTLDIEISEYIEASQRKVESVSDDLVLKSKLLGDKVDNKDINGNNISISKLDFILTETVSEAKMALDTEEKLPKIVDSNFGKEKERETSQTTNSETGVATEYKDKESIEILPVKSDRDEMLIEKISGQGTKDSSKFVSKSSTESETSLNREAIGAENEGSRDGSSDVPCTDGNVSTNESSIKTEIEGDSVQGSRKVKCEEQEDLKKKTVAPSESTDDIDAAPKRIRNISTPPLAKDVIPENFPVTKDETFTGMSKRTDQSDNESNESTSPTKRSLRNRSQGPNAPLNESKIATKSRRLSEESQTVSKSSESADFAARKRRAATPDTKLRERMTVAKSSPRRPTKPGNSQTESSNTPKKLNIRSNQSTSETKSAKSSSASTAGSGVSTRKTRRGTKEKD